RQVGIRLGRDLLKCVIHVLWGQPATVPRLNEWAGVEASDFVKVAVEGFACRLRQKQLAGDSFAFAADVGEMVVAVLRNVECEKLGHSESCVQKDEENRLVADWLLVGPSVDAIELLGCRF